jgi:hypothetical protein
VSPASAGFSGKEGRFGMRTTIALVVSALACVTLQAADVYGPVKEIAIGGEGGWDYLSVDAASHRLYVSHATKIVVADTDSGAIVGEIPDLPGIHGLPSPPISDAASRATGVRIRRRSSISRR